MPLSRQCPSLRLSSLAQHQPSRLPPLATKSTTSVSHSERPPSGSNSTLYQRQSTQTAACRRCRRHDYPQLTAQVPRLPQCLHLANLGPSLRPIRAYLVLGPAGQQCCLQDTVRDANLPITAQLILHPPDKVLMEERWLQIVPEPDLYVDMTSRWTNRP